LGRDVCQAVRETDAVDLCSRVHQHQVSESTGHGGPVSFRWRYHNIEQFAATRDPSLGRPTKSAHGRMTFMQKKIDTILRTSSWSPPSKRRHAQLHGGAAISIALRHGRMLVSGRVTLHGRYDQPQDLPKNCARNHGFIYTSRYEGGPCLSLIELCMRADMSWSPRGTQNLRWAAGTR